MTINWSKVLKDSKVKKMKAMVSSVMGDIKVDDNGKGWLYPDDDTRSASIKVQVALAECGHLPDDDADEKVIHAKVQKSLVKLNNCVHLEQALRATTICVIEVFHQGKPRVRAAIDRAIKEIAKAGDVEATVLTEALMARMDDLEKQNKANGSGSFTTDGVTAFTVETK